MAPGDLVTLLDLATLGDEDADLVVGTRRELCARIAAKVHDVDDATVGAMGHPQRGIAHVMRLRAKDGPEQPLLGGECRLALGRDLAHQDVARPDLGADADDALVIEVGEHLLGLVGDLARDLLGTELGIACLDLVLRDVDGRQQILLNDTLGDDDAILVVVALPRHVGHGKVSP